MAALGHKQIEPSLSLKYYFSKYKQNIEFDAYLSLFISVCITASFVVYISQQRYSFQLKTVFPFAFKANETSLR